MKRKKPQFTFIDLYAGIGGIRYAFESAGGECVFSSEWDKYSQKTYEAFHGKPPEVGDITPVVDELEENPDAIQEHNILTAGFPCQPFSLAGVSKKQSMGRLHGFDDPTQGTEFFKVKEILRIKRPEAFLLENVKNLKGHDGGITFKVIEEELEKAGYVFTSRVIDASGWVPQHRERIYIIGIDKKFGIKKEALDEIYPEVPKERIYELDEILLSNGKTDPKYTLGPGTWSTLERHKAHHESIGQGFGYTLLKPPFADTVTRTISARYHKDGAEVLISQGNGKRPRRLTPFEACRLMGFPEKCWAYYNGEKSQPVSDTQAYRQFGNSVAVPVVSAIAKNMVKLLKDNAVIS